MRHLLPLLLAVSLSFALPARAEVTVVLDDFEDLAANPWAFGDGESVAPTDAGHTGKAAKVTLRKTADELALLRPCDIPADITGLKLWVQGSPGCKLALQPVFKDPQGFIWFAPSMGLDFTGWKELAVKASPKDLQADWRMGWWKGNKPKGSTTVYEMTLPLRFLGFKAQGPNEATSATVVIDDLSAVCSGEKPYVHFPRGVVVTPDKAAFPLVVYGGSAGASGTLTVKAASRNDVALDIPALSLPVNVPAGGSQRLEAGVSFSRPGLYRFELSGAGLTGKVEKHVQAVSSLRGAAAFQALSRPAKPFSTDIKLSPKQTHRRAWESDSDKPMVMYVSELSPAWLLKNNTTPRYTLFSSIDRWGLGAPTYLALPTAGGARVFAGESPAISAALPAMDRSWMLCWFAGAKGFVDWDAPYLVVLQHKPRAVTLDAAGLTLDFADKAGYLAVLPLYGAYKPPQAGKMQFVQAGLAPKDVLPFQWAGGLPKNIVDRCDWWAKVLKAYPVDCDEQFSVDAEKDDLVVKSTFQYLTIKDDWNTQPIRYAPIPYVLGNCVWGKTFPVTFDAPVHDPVYPSTYGPYMGIENADGYTYRMHVLQYVHEVAALGPAKVDSPLARKATEALRSYVTTSSLSPTSLTGQKEPNLCWSIWTDQRWQSSNLLYIDHPGIQLGAQLTRQEFFGRQLFSRIQYDEADVGVNRKFLFFPAPGWGFQGDAGKITMDTYYTAWLYAYATGDYQLIADKWDDVISRLNCLPFTMCWAKMGRDAIAEGGDEAPPPMGMARLAYAIGDMDSYAYACYLFARELTHAYVKVGAGADYFRAYQPIDALENMDWAGKNQWPKAGPIPQRANVTNMFGETAGWVLGGPPDGKRMYEPEVWNEKPRGRDKARKELADVLPWGYFGTGQWVQKWSRFDAEDVFRFYHDNALDRCRTELDTWLKVEFPGLPETRYPDMGGFSSRADGYPPTPWRLMQLRGDILQESEAELAKLYPPDQWAGAQQTFYQGMIRSARPREVIRIIPKGPPTPFQPGVQRDSVANPSWDNPVQTPAGLIDEKTKKGTNWPTPTWYFALPPKTPGGSSGTGDRWGFGYITNGTPKPANVTQETCNWVMDVYTFE